MAGGLLSSNVRCAWCSALGVIEHNGDARWISIENGRVKFDRIHANPEDSRWDEHQTDCDHEALPKWKM